MRLGRCNKLTLAAPTVALSGGATATWTTTSANHATWVVNHPAGGSCGGTTTGPNATFSLKCFGCGKIKVSVAGTGAHSVALPVASVFITTPLATTSAQGFLTLTGTTGGASCSSAALVVSGGGAANKTFNVTCGSRLKLSFASPFNTAIPAVSVTFTIQLLP